MKKKAKKLTLSRDILRTAAPSDLAGVVGGVSALCSSEHCTETCAVTSPQTYCHCPTGESVPIRSCSSGTCP
jgi:hypothetical protein